ncbi:ATP-binding protein [Nocardioides sp. YIM 152588]|uniref:ATP-binding protein n=1 Tax=Nocardioides sp. YIM 152588 TaxID=3158259 RepID=UPI0032E529C1
MAATNASRVRALRREAFVGRHAELASVLGALDGDEAPAMVYVHGPGGVGKSTLLTALADRLADGSGHGARPCLRVDGQDVEASPEALTAALRSLRRGAGTGGADDLCPPGGVLMVDRFELLAGLERWVWHDLLPTLPADSVLVVAGRNPPPEEWRADPVWASLAFELPLRNLTAPDAAALLRARGVSDEPLVEDLVRATCGHPLALVIAADQALAPAAAEPSAGGPLFGHPDTAARLLGRFIDDTVTADQRRALHVCGHARRVDRALLREVLDLDEDAADALLTWLRERPYAEAHPDGLTVHDVVRDALDHDLRWRDREAFADLHRRVRGTILRRIEQGTAAEAHRAANDLLFLHRGNPTATALYAFADLGSLVPRPVTPETHAQAVEAFGRSEGPARRAAAAHWLALQPGAGHLVEDARGDLRGALVHPVLSEASPEERAADPVAAFGWEAISRRRPPEPREVVFHWAIADVVSPDRLGGFSDVVAAVSLRAWTVPRLGWVLVSSLWHETWAPIWTYIGFEPLGEVAVTGPEGEPRTVGVWARDFARSDYSDWLEGLAAREIDEHGTVPPPVAAPVALAREDFDAAVRSALRDLTRPDRLLASPLLGSRMCQAGDGDGREAAALVSSMRRAVRQVAADPRTEVAARTLDRTYLRPAATQERAAEVLDLPFSTYRRHLRAGVERLCDVLWSWELHGPPPASGDPSSARPGGREVDST